MTAYWNTDPRFQVKTRRIGLLLSLLWLMAPALPLAASPQEIDLSVKLDVSFKGAKFTRIHHDR